MTNHAENELDVFLAGMQSYQRNYLEQGYSSLTPEEVHQFNEWFRRSDEWLSAPNPDEELIAGSLPVIAQAYKLLLAQAPAMLKERRKREEREMRGGSSVIYRNRSRESQAGPPSARRPIRANLGA